jgi:GT2 family glycosyltransferase
MIESLLKLRNQQVGMIAARTEQPGDGMDSRLRAKRGEVGADVVLTDGFLPFYCVVAWRSMFQKTGFIHSYYPAGYEDEEFAYRMRANNYRQAICGKAWVKHTEGATIRALCAEKPEMVQRIEQNRDFCLVDIRKLMAKA